MKKIVKDGWHVMAGVDVYVENGMVVRGITKDWSQPLYIYKFDKKMNVYTNIIVPVSTFARRLKEGKIRLF